MTEEDMLEKTFTTFHASNLLLQQQYRERGFKKYSQLIVCLLLAEQNNELLLKNHEARPTGSSPFPEVNAVQTPQARSTGSSSFPTGNVAQIPQFGQGHGRGLKI